MSGSEKLSIAIAVVILTLVVGGIIYAIGWAR